MSLLTALGADNSPENLKSVDGAVSVGNAPLKVRENFTTLDNWDVIADAKDLVLFGGDTAGAGYWKISKDPFTLSTETKLISKFRIKPPFRVALGLSISQRIPGQKLTFELASVDEKGNVETSVPLATAVAITTAAQSGSTTLTVTTATAHGLVPGDRVAIYGCSDSRLNYGDLVVEALTSPTVFTTTSEQIGTLPSITATSNVGYVVKKDPLFNQGDSFSIMFEGTTATQARHLARADKGAFIQSSQSTFTSTDTVRGNSAGYCDSLQPAAIWDVRFKAEAIILRSFGVDSLTTNGGTLKRSQNLPNIDKQYKIVIRAVNNIEGMSRPVCKIASATKAGSTTATIVTDVPHGLTTGDQIQIYGIRDQTNFANLTTTTAVASVTNGTTFTIAFGASYTGVSYGGYVVKVSGGHAHATPNIAVQSIARTSGLMTVTGNTTWTGMGVGDTVNLYGLYDTAGTSYAQYEGAYKVAYMSTTSLVLYAPGPDFGSVNVGGAVVRRTDFRVHLLRAIDYSRHIVDVDSGNGDTTDAQEAIPVAVTGTPSMSVSGTPTVTGAAAHDAAISGNPVRIGGRAMTANYTGVSTGDVADFITTIVGALITKPFSIPEGDWTFACASPVVNTTDVAIKAAGAAGIKNYLTCMQYQNTNATATEIVVKDGSTVIWRGYAPANMAQPATINFETPLRGTAATAMNFAAITTAANIYVNAQGYQAP